MRELSWRRDGRAAGEADVRRVEVRLHVAFPNDFRRFISEHQGGVPFETDFTIQDARKRDVSIGFFLKIVRDDGDSTLKTVDGAYQALGGRIDEKVVPFAVGPGGDVVMLDYRGKNSPGVCYWHHEREGLTTEYTHVTNSFSQFLDVLQRPNDEESCD